ncbi:gliding motility-associated ABC transporter permease subunit GldF [uncultured Christiangramia sp.]|uniref:gliding motility-associated ABC transporter permease subunit GldF n=1 Tax=Christiangramia sp. 3-2217-3z TaxID=3417564 RepID=UPI00261C266F|nr:gliding motility-associated ABC transporter permease subunit GldF [uncultured Christiangramia sp.]
MFAIFKKEIQSFFANLTGYLVIGVFLLISGLFLFVFSGGYNILDSGFADLKPFFDLAPWIFIFLIPAISMRSYSEEKRMGTMEILQTRPISSWDLVFGKYLGGLILVLLAIIPSLIYLLAIGELGQTTYNFDTGATIGSYLGLIFLAASYTAIGTYASSITSNQIVAFLIGVFLCFAIYYAFEALATINIFGEFTYLLEYFGISYHYRSISRGVLDTRDLIYFVSVIALFLKLTQVNISSAKNRR